MVRARLPEIRDGNFQSLMGWYRSVRSDLSSSEQFRRIDRSGRGIGRSGRGISRG